MDVRNDKSEVVRRKKRFKFKKFKMAEKMAVSITFDENNSIRVLDSEKFKETDNIRNECN